MTETGNQAEEKRALKQLYSIHKRLKRMEGKLNVLEVVTDSINNSIPYRGLRFPLRINWRDVALGVMALSVVATAVVYCVTELSK